MAASMPGPFVFLSVFFLGHPAQHPSPNDLLAHPGRGFVVCWRLPKSWDDLEDEFPDDVRMTFIIMFRLSLGLFSVILGQKKAVYSMNNKI